MGQSTVNKRQSERGSSGIGRIFSVVRVLRRSSTALSLTAVSQQAGIAASTAHSLLTELLAHGAVTLDENKRYRLGPSLFYLGSAFARGTPLFRSTWIELVDMANEFGVTGALAVPWDEHHLIIGAHQGGRRGVDVAFGGRVPLDGGSWGKAYFALAGQPLPAKLVSYTSKTVTDHSEYQRQLDGARTLGYSVDSEEFADGVAGVGAGVTSDRGYEGLASLMWSVGAPEIDTDVVGRRLAALTARASLSLGDNRRVASVGIE